ncbi:alpha/beta hydrolase [Mucilaginibacter sp. HMF5004]|uniref:alpha/beta hydrolase family protein n=1 Tax=Mucilaginibacter rivuli TaxID=2857527 RepID=UPI001C5EB148|nr:alpha/beta fold hydrolase [Mucilaginibacter rivuli]MBW4890943.1 alpha/beta hydrolase [Mucilaginibacter rivuli]
MRKVILSCVFILFALGSFAQDITGTWYGAMLTPGGKFTLIFHINKDEDLYGSTMDSPAQNFAGVPTAGTTFTNSNLTIIGPGAVFSFTGKYNIDSNKVFGTFTQGTVKLPMTFTRDLAGTAVRRPQDAKDYPYIKEEITVLNAKAPEVMLSGTLTMPRDKKASKIVVLITGSGPENRDEEMYDHRPFGVLADWLTRQGIAVIRCDDRGVGKSTGNFLTATTYDFADDANAIVSYIKSRADLKDMKVGLVGHSEGGVMAAIAAGQNKQVDFTVLLASPGVPLTRILIEGTELASGSNDASSLYEKIYQFIIQNPTLSTDEINKGIDAVIYKTFALTPGGKINSLTAKAFSDLCKAQGFSGPWFRKYVALEPVVFISKLQCPVLAINGTLDMVVRSEENLNAIKGALQAGGNKHFEVTPITNLNHLFQTTKPGPIVTYDKISETFSPVALAKVSDWINGLK